MIDVRTPADPQDFETSVCRPPRRPRDFFVKRDSTGSGAIFTILDWQEPAARAKVSGYRVYFVAYSVGTYATIGNPLNNSGGFRMSNPVAEAPATFKGGKIEIANNTVANAKGWYYCVSLNRDGQESEPNGPVASPWNV